MKVITKASDKIPHSWDQVTFSQYLALNDSANDYIKILSTFLEIDYDTIKKAKVENFEAVVAALSFLKQEPIFFDTPTTLAGKTIPRDVTFETTMQFEDMRLLLVGFDQKSPIDQIKTFAEIAAIYYQPTTGEEYDSQKTKELLPEIYKMGCVEVISVGRFFFYKVLSSLTDTPINSLRPTTPARRRTLAILHWLKLLAFIQRCKASLKETLQNKRSF